MQKLNVGQVGASRKLTPSKVYVNSSEDVPVVTTIEVTVFTNSIATQDVSPEIVTEQYG